MSEPAPDPQKQELDTLRVYGISFDFPVTQKLEFDPRFTRGAGSVAVKSPTRSVVFVTWGELQKVVTKLPTPREHSKYSMDRAAKNAKGTLKPKESRDVEVNGHSAAYSRAEIEMPRGMLGPPRRNQEIESVHLHCERTSRYFVIFRSVDLGRTREPGDDVLQVVAGSFKCH